MSKELVIGSNRHETKVGVLEDDQLVEVYFQRGNEYSLAGSIHKGRVTRVLPGMQSAFVDLGLERDTFLYVSDFFEEHEDIDVAEERPRGSERRDRNPGRGGERSVQVEQRLTEVREIRSVIPEESLTGEPSTEAESAENAPATEASSSSPESSNGKPVERAETDRGFRNERRGRRSRRRRQRGRGFPESKYVQAPGSTTATREAQPEDTVGAEDEKAADVIILPGESLAKYRNRAVGSSEPVDEEDADSELNPGPPASAESSDIPEEQAEEKSHEDLIAEAEEIELADKVFAHRPEELDDDETEVLEEEAKLREVETDHPAIESTAEHKSEELEPAAISETEIAEPTSRLADAYEPVEPPRQISTPIIVASSSEVVPEGPVIEVDEFEGADIEDVPIEADDLTETPVEAAASETVPEQAAEGAQPQTASVRDQGSRYMHRVSRRTRRRRGGNRFGQQGEHTPGTEAVAAGSGAAAATALEPEARFESRREARESREERTVAAERPENSLPSISDLLKPGQEIIVQIAKEPLGQKGARITSHVALPGRYVVFMPSVSHLGVSRKVSSEEERQRLKRILQAHRVGTTGGFIVRTAGEGISEEEIAADMNFLYNLWLDIRQKAEKKPAPALLHYDLDIVQRILRDQVTEDFKAIWVDNEDMYENVVTFMQRFQPSLVNRVKMYTRSAPIFDAFSITQELEKALRPKVWLKSGGYIVINQTEALVAIDINTGKYVGKSNRLEDTIVKTNTEAVREIVRQIRLRDLGGIIVVDFIDMDERKNRQKVMQALEEAMRADKAPYKILQFNDFGLVAITRKRVKQSLERTLCSPCPYCEGAGYVKSVQTIIGEILVEAQKLAKAIEGKDVVLRVHPEVAKTLKSSSNRYLEELEEVLGRPVLVTGDLTLHTEKFDLA